MNDIELLKEIDELLDDEAKDILANIKELGQLQKTVHTLIAVEHMRSERVNEIRRRMFAYSKMRLQEVKGEA